MKKQPKQKLSINKETIRRLSPAELTLVRGGDLTDVPLNPDQDGGTYRECLL
ncbi:MAG TPA: class I lanthipeptide [Myxococcaceae bacterium]|nr:class I lanthipeptide [Myxococcaceae bacterium]